MCVLKVIDKDYWLDGEREISIVTRDGKYGLIRVEHTWSADGDYTQAHFIEHGLCDCYYDAIYNLKCDSFFRRMASGYFVVFSSGRCGLVEVSCSDDETLFECRERTACVFDSIESYHSNENILILHRGEKAHYFNLHTKLLSPEYDAIHVRDSFLICIANSETIIINPYNDTRFMEVLL